MEEWITLAKLVKDIGLGICAFGLCAWMVIYIVKKLTGTIEIMIDTIKEMLTSLKMFMAMVKVEHRSLMENVEELKENNKEDHRAFAEQNRETTAVLGRINGFKDDHGG